MFKIDVTIFLPVLGLMAKKLRILWEIRELNYQIYFSLFEQHVCFLLNLVNCQNTPTVTREEGKQHRPVDCVCLLHTISQQFLFVE